MTSTHSLKPQIHFIRISTLWEDSSDRTYKYWLQQIVSKFYH